MRFSRLDGGCLGSWVRGSALVHSALQLHVRRHKGVLDLLHFSSAVRTDNHVRLKGISNDEHAGLKKTHSFCPRHVDFPSVRQMVHFLWSNRCP